MPTPGNSINESTTGIAGFTGTGFTASPMTQYQVVLGSSTSSTLTQVSGTGTSGQVLTSNGAGANPTWQPGSGSPGWKVSTGIIDSPTWKNIFNSPVEIVPSQGATSLIVIDVFGFNFVYGGNNAFTSGGNVLLGTTGTGFGSIGILPSSYTGTTTNAFTSVYIPTSYSAATNLYNAGISITTSVGNPGGNAANDNSIHWFAIYYVYTQ